jgi:hypothetical protein
MSKNKSSLAIVMMLFGVFIPLLLLLLLLPHYL